MYYSKLPTTLTNDTEEVEVFMLMETISKTQDLSRINPFLAAKVINNAIGTKALSVNKLKDGKLLIKVANQKQANKLTTIKKSLMEETKPP